jgi:hypothetical protein
MPPLDSKLRDQLDKVCQTARDLAVSFARSALQKRGVDAAEALPHFGAQERELRNRLRARGRQVGDVRTADGTQSIEQLSQELAYEYWHRMLFARFLAENNLLMHPDGVAVSLEECEELAASADPPAANGFVLAARYASAMLPQIFRTDDVLLEIEFAPEQRLALEKLLASLPKQTFEADDSLGWVYQFWQTAEKKRVNDSGEKIDGRTLPAVTQLFTEHYMVEFLLHNTIGAWWCAKEEIQGPPGGAGIPAGKSPVEMPYLRWRDDCTPAAGKFEGWPKTLAEFTMLDPCCGSGHFLVAAFNLLVPLRMHDEHLSAIEASEAVLRDNLFGLELDSRCTQIAAFALALAAWKYSNCGGYRSLPTVNIACSGQGLTGRREEWLALANGDTKLRNGMDRIYDLFHQAPHLGSLIDPRQERGDLFEAGFTKLQPLLATALSARTPNEDLHALGVVAQGIARAADLLVKEYTLVVTNVPYLGRGDQCELLQDWSNRISATGRGDLATTFIDRMLRFGKGSHTIGVVSPHEWWFLKTAAPFRKHLLTDTTWSLAATLGEEAWRSFGIRGPKATLLILESRNPDASHSFGIIDALSVATIGEKCNRLREGFISWSVQQHQHTNPDHRITQNGFAGGTLLSTYAVGLQGVSTADSPRFVQFFWEHAVIGGRWQRFQGSISRTCFYGGRESIIDLGKMSGEATSLGAAIRGRGGWGKKGVAVRQLRSLYVTLYTGEMFDSNVAVIVPKEEKMLSSLWSFCSSPRFTEEIRRIDMKKNVTNGTMVKVPFDTAHWEKIAEGEFPNGLPQPHSNDPTQWLFTGFVTGSTDPLQVAAARVMGFAWPDQCGNHNGIEAFADANGILCLHGLRGELAAAERLLELLRMAYGSNWSEPVLETLLTDAGCKAGATLNDWLRNQFFEQHGKLFHNRPFIWHIWDGRKDGFSALVNYHKLTHKTLENLTYSYLGDWIAAQSKSDKAGADLRLAAAQALQDKLKLILAGEPPYDIFVRWKPLHEQAIGWNPDLNDGVRMNIRPFMQAGILRKNPNIKWTKDRGKEPLRDQADYPWFWSGDTFVGDRVNDIHLTNAEKEAARKRRKGSPS